MNPKLLGIDVGLKDFLATSGGEVIPIPQYFRKSEARLATLQRQAARKEKVFEPMEEVSKIKLLDSISRFHGNVVISFLRFGIGYSVDTISLSMKN